jgi:hypothetical protein
MLAGSKPGRMPSRSAGYRVDVWAFAGCGRVGPGGTSGLTNAEPHSVPFCQDMSANDGSSGGVLPHSNGCVQYVKKKEFTMADTLSLFVSTTSTAYHFSWRRKQASPATTMCFGRYAL